MNRINLFNSAGEEINLSTLGLIGLKLEIPSPSYRRVFETMDGRPGEVLVESVLSSRSLVASFMVKASNYIDSLDSRDLLYELIGHGQAMYISEAKQPTKRWKVYANGWVPERANATVSLFEVPLLVESGTAESVSVIESSFSSLPFRFENEGNIIIDPSVHSEMEIEFSGVSTNLTIENLTTGDEWSWNGTTVEGDTILLKGARSLKNNISIFGLTNKKTISIGPGWNDFDIYGTTGDFELTIRTRFYFL